MTLLLKFFDVGQTYKSRRYLVGKPMNFLDQEPKNVNVPSARFLSVKPGFHMIVTVGDASATCPQSVGDIWKRSLL